MCVSFIKKQCVSVSWTTNLFYLKRKNYLKKKAKLPKNVAASIEQDGATLGDENRNIMNKMFNGTTHTELSQEHIKNVCCKIHWCLTKFHFGSA